MDHRHVTIPRYCCLIGILLVGVAVAVLGCQPAPLTSPASRSNPRSFQIGMDYVGWYAGAYSGSDSDESLRNLAANGIRWVAIVVTAYQETLGTTAVHWQTVKTPTDADVVHAIQTAHGLGLKVMLKPHVDLMYDPGHWRGQIGNTFRGPDDWQRWFASYDAGLLHLADLARDNHVDQLCIGTELLGTTGHEAEWRTVVQKVRELFPGPLTYAGNHDGEEKAIQWWDALDYIGVDAYYPLSDQTDPSVADLKAAWVTRGYVELLQTLAKRYGKPVLFTEIGYRAIAGAAADPSDWKAFGPRDDQTQANLYQAAIETFADQPWFAGFFWWAWPASPLATGGEAEWSPGGKEAERVLRAFVRAH